MSLTILITYCSNERMFVDALLQAALHAADCGIVCVAVGRRLFNGRVEDVEHINDLIARYPNVYFTWFEVPEHLLATPIVLHNNARIAALNKACQVSKGAIFSDSWVILLDGDEVPCNTGCPLLEWWRSGWGLLNKRHIYKLANRWFFLHPRLVSEHTEDSVVLVHGSHLTDKAMRHPRERDGICMTAIENGGACFRDVHGLDGTPMFDHFSWVRANREDLISKVTNWGHTGERDWLGMIDKALEDLKEGRLPERDFVHGRRLLLLDK